MKVKIFNCNQGDELEEEINKFLDNNKDIEVIDIKYNTLKGRGVFGDDWYSYSALIMYQYKIVMTVTEAEARAEDLRNFCDAIMGMRERLSNEREIV